MVVLPILDLKSEHDELIRLIYVHLWDGQQECLGFAYCYEGVISNGVISYFEAQYDVFG